MPQSDAGLVVKCNSWMPPLGSPASIKEIKFPSVYTDYIALSDTKLAQVGKEIKSCPVLSMVHMQEMACHCRQAPSISTNTGT